MKSTYRHRFLTVIFAMVIFSITLLTSLDSEFIGELKSYDEFLIVSQTEDYQLIRLIAHDSSDVDYALYTTQSAYVFTFTQEDMQFIVDAHMLSSTDYRVIHMPFSNSSPIELQVHQSDVLVHHTMFMYIKDYEDARGLQYSYQNFDQLMISNYRTQSLFSFLFQTELKILYLPIVFYTVFGMMLFIVIYTYLFAHVGKWYACMFKKPTSDITKKIKDAVIYVLTNLLGGFFLYALTVVFLVLVSGGDLDESEDVNTNVNVLYFTIEDQEVPISIFIGIQDYAISDSDMGKYTVVYTFEFPSQLDKVWVGSFVCDAEIFGYAKSHITQDTRSDVIHQRQIEMYQSSDCQDAQTFYIIIRDPHTGMILKTSDTHTLYKTYEEVVLAFDVSLEANDPIPSLLIYAFHVIVSMPLLRKGYKKVKKTRHI